MTVATNHSKKFLLLLIIAAAIFNFSFLEYNNHKIKQANPANVERNAGSLVEGQTVFSIDNEYYLSPVENYLAGKGWRRGAAVGDGDYLRRVPGYSIVYYGFVKVFGKTSAHWWLKIFQLCLFLATIPVIFFLCRLITNEYASRITTGIYAFIPFVSSWAYFTLTESISPVLTLFYVFFALKAKLAENERIKLTNYIASSFFLIAAVLTRPYIAIAGVILLVFAFNDYLLRLKDLKGFFRFSLVWLIPVILLGAWAARNYIITKEVVLLEKAFHPQSLDRMKPEFRGMLTFTKSWGEDGAKFTLYHEPFFWPAVAGDTGSAPIQHILKSWPNTVLNDFGYDRLYSVLKVHQAVIASYKPYYDAKTAMPDSFSSAALQVEEKYRQLTKEFRKNHPLTFWIIARFTYLKRMIFHSNTPNIFLFQKEANPGKPLLAYKAVLFLLHIFFYLSLLVNVFLLKGWVKRTLFVYTPILFILFISFIHREVEARYMLPVLPLLLVGSAMVTEKTLYTVKNIFSRKRVNLATDGTN